MGSGAPTAGAEIQEKMVRENGEGGRRRKAAGEGKGMEIDRELLSLRPPVDSALRFVSPVFFVCSGLGRETSLLHLLQISSAAGKGTRIGGFATTRTS